MRIFLKIHNFIESNLGYWLTSILYSIIRPQKRNIKMIVSYILNSFYKIFMPLYVFVIHNKKLISFYILKSILVLFCFLLCFFLIALVLLQRAEEGAFRRAISAGQGLDSKDLIYKTIYFSVLYLVIIIITQYVFYHIYLKGI